MDYFKDLLRLAEQEFNTVIKAGKFRSREEVDTIGKLVDMYKDILKIYRMEDEGYSEYGGRIMPYHDGYDGGAYGRGRGAKRDAMGRYSRDDGYHDNYPMMGRGYAGTDEFSARSESVV